MADDLPVQGVKGCTVDTVSIETRRNMMRAIGSKNTAPERAVRSAAHRMGLRFRLHVSDLPGRPDMVFPRHRTVIFVHGCFWHRHDCSLAAMPKTRVEFWLKKFEANVARDARNRLELEQAGWRVVEIWECETREPAMLSLRLSAIFGHSAYESLDDQ